MEKARSLSRIEQKTKFKCNICHVLLRKPLSPRRQRESYYVCQFCFQKVFGLEGVSVNNVLHYLNDEDKWLPEYYWNE